jgi:recombination protein RecA
MDDVSDALNPPEYFFDTGSCILNRIISGKYDGGYPEQRMTMIGGGSGTGKSFLIGNAAREVLKKGYGVFIIDSEHALDNEYMRKIGVDVDNPYYSYNGVDSIATATKVLATFFNEYEKAPKSEQIPYLICIDSLDELKTDTQAEKGKKGENPADMGQQAKQLKSFQSIIMHRIRKHRMGVVATKQTYQNQDSYTNKREPEKITHSLKFAYTQIVMLTNRLLKDNMTNKFEGIILEAFGAKTRLTKPFQKCIIEVPYETGMDWYSGILEAAEALGVVTRSGAWYTFGENKFQRKNLDEYKDAIFKEVKAIDDVLEYEIPTEDLDKSD